MNDFLARALDLDALRFGAENVRLGFERPMPGWAWFGMLAGCAVFAFWSYSRLTGAAWARMALATLRTLLLALLLVLFAGPQLVERTETTEQDWVLVLVDRSASMTVADATVDDDARAQRDAQLRAMLADSWPTWARMADERTVVWLGFDAGAYELAANPGSGLALAEPAGRRTDLASALDQALRRAAARPLAGVVVFSDGRSVDEPGRAALRRLQAERVPVHVMPLGSTEPIADFAVRRIEAPRSAFVDDITPVRALIERLGSGAGGATLRLVDAATGITLDERRLDADDFTPGGIEVALTHRAVDPGEADWRVEIVPDREDLIPGNNTAQARLELVDRPLRVLYVDGYPRWEQRYLKNLLIRERSVVSSNLLLAPNRRYQQESDVELQRLPVSIEEWAEYDVVVLGDVSPEVFSTVQLENLREHIATRGAGLLWIGGPGATPSAWAGGALADLLPFTGGVESVTPSTLGVIVEPATTSEAAGVLRLGDDIEDQWPASLRDPASGWSVLRWSQRLDVSALKPAATPLAWAVVADDIGATDPEAWPLVVSMRYGAGRTVFVGTDEIWRWRYGQGELLPERFWLQIVRLLGRESLSRSGKSAALVISPRRAELGQPVRVAVELLDQSLVDAAPSAIEVRLTRRPDAGEDPDALTGAIDLTLRPEQRGGRVYAATWLPGEPGVWRAEVNESLLASLDLTDEAVVSHPDDELRSPETDHDLLARLADQTGGVVLQASDLDNLPALLPNRRQRIINEQTEALWDSPLALTLLLLLVTVEWVGRRLVRLV
jgi:hypothetical protein